MLSLEGTKLKFVLGPRPAHDHGENCAQKVDLMAEPETPLPPPFPGLTPNFLFAVQIVPRGGTIWELAVQ